MSRAIRPRARSAASPTAAQMSPASPGTEPPASAPRKPKDRWTLLVLIVLIAAVSIPLIPWAKSTILSPPPPPPNKQEQPANTAVINTGISSTSAGVYIFIALIFLYVVITVFLFARFGSKALEFYKRISPLMWLVTALTTGSFALRLIEGMQTLSDIFIALAVLLFIWVIANEFLPNLLTLRVAPEENNKTLKDENENHK